MKSGLKIAASVGGVLITAGAVTAISLAGGSGGAAAPAKTAPASTSAAAIPTATLPALVKRSQPAKPRHPHRKHASHPARHKHRGIIARTKGPVVTNQQPPVAAETHPAPAPAPSEPPQQPSSQNGGAPPPIGNPVGSATISVPSDSAQE